MTKPFFNAALKDLTKAVYVYNILFLKVCKIDSSLGAYLQERLHSVLRMRHLCPQVIRSDLLLLHPRLLQKNSYKVVQLL